MKAKLEEVDVEVAEWAGSVAAGSTPSATPRMDSSSKLLHICGSPLVNGDNNIPTPAGNC